MNAIGLLLACLLSGFLLMKRKYFDKKSPIVLNNLIVYFFIPVITLYHIPKIEFEFQFIWLTITPFLVYFSSILFVKVASRFFDLDRKTEGALIMTSGIGSTSFVGFPIFEILYGAEGLSQGIILSLAGTILVFNTLGVSTGLYYGQEHKNYGLFFRRLLTFPPLVFFILAVLLNFFSISIPPAFDQLLSKLAAPFSVIALLAIGMQIDFTLDRASLKALFIGQFHKLVFAPLLVFIFLWYIIGVQDLTARVCLLGAAIGSMNAVSILAAQMGLNPKLASLMPAIGIPISIPVLFIIDYLVK